MAKKIKYDPADLHRGKTVTVVARKEGEQTRAKDMEYTKAIEAKRKFDRAGYYCALYQEGFYQGPKTNNNPKTKAE